MTRKTYLKRKKRDLRRFIRGSKSNVYIFMHDIFASFELRLFESIDSWSPYFDVQYVRGVMVINTSIILGTKQ